MGSPTLAGEPKVILIPKDPQKGVIPSHPLRHPVTPSSVTIMYVAAVLAASVIERKPTACFIGADGAH